MKIISDSSVMYSIQEGLKHGLHILPLSVVVGEETWHEYEQITPSGLIEKIKAGAMPTSSCPSPQMYLDAMDTDEEALVLSMAEGLSGSYSAAASLSHQARNPEKVAVVNTQTLCVPHRAIALCAVELSKQCKTATELANRLKPLIDSTHSYLVPEDFDYLRRGGRLTPLAAKIANLIKAAPVVCQTPDGTRLEKFTLARNFKKGIDAIAEDLKKHGVGEGHFIGISHAENEKAATWAKEKLQSIFPACEMGIFELSPVFIAQGGSGCVAIQSINLNGFPKVDLQ